MKFSRILLMTVMVLLLVTGAASCSFLNPDPPEKLETKIYNYLSEKYPGMEFEITSYTQDTYTSGKYVLNVTCKTTEIDFLVYHSSFLTTDSYTVTYANLAMEELILGILGEDVVETYVDSVQWLDLYADGSTGYRFREVDLTQAPFTTADIKDIYHIFIHANDTDTLLTAINAISEKLSVAGIACEKIAFEWVLDDYTTVFTTNTYTLEHISEKEFSDLLRHIQTTRQNDDIVSVAPLSRLKTARYFLDKSDGKVTIPETDGGKPENEKPGNGNSNANNKH